MNWIESIQYEIVPSKKLSLRQHQAINGLLYASLKTDFPNRTDGELIDKVTDSMSFRTDLNRSVGGSSIRANQVYTQAVHVLAYDVNQTLTAAVPFANNASKPKLPAIEKYSKTVAGIAAYGILQAKLHYTEGSMSGRPFIKSRYLWAGQPALSEAARENITAADEGTLQIIGGLLLAGSYTRNLEQPVSVFTYTQERDWQYGLAANGLQQTDAPAEEIYAFGTKNDPVMQSQWKATDIGVMEDVILSKTGAVQTLARTRWQ